MKTGAVQLSGQVLLKVGMCLLTLGLFFWVLVMPQLENVRRLDKEIAEANALILRQDKLFPLFATISGALTRADLSLYPEAQGGPLGMEDIPSIPGLLGELARAHGLEVRTVTPAPDSLDVTTNTLETQCVFLGDLHSVRRFMTSLGGLQCVSGLQTLRIEDAGGRTLVTLKAVISLAKQRGGSVAALKG